MLFLRNDNGLLTYMRSRDPDRVIVAINNNDAIARWPVQLPVGTFPEGAMLADLLGQAPSVKVKGGKININLGPRSAAIFKAN